MAIGAIKAKLFFHIISHFMSLNFKQKKAVCLKINSKHITFLLLYFFNFFRFYLKIIEKIILLKLHQLQFCSKTLLCLILLHEQNILSNDEHKLLLITIE
jgi:hypothetical protein